MHYAEPGYISVMIFITVIAALFFIWATRRRINLMNRFVEKSLAGSIAPTISFERKAIKMGILTAAVSLIVFSLARPQWGFEWKETKFKGLDILIAVDVSKSMLAADMKPNRLERAKFAVKDLVKKMGGDRVGLIAFAGTAFLQCPLTIDYNGFLLTLDDLNVSTIPRGGTNISSAIREAMGIFSAGRGSAVGEKGLEKKYKTLILITDGDDLEGEAMRAAKEASDEGVRIYCVGVGTFEGSLIPAADEHGSRGWVADKGGNVVKTRLNEDVLKNIAISTGGSYVRATQSDFGLVLLYDKSISKLEKKDIEGKMNKQYQERFGNFLGLAILLLLIEPFISERKRLPR
ncbi:MAG: VWA domain-containing protein [Candidatus Omnitrophota bacterium]|nr:VWA domain-containing protein [Candidatus Omnitrophota bacterium]